MAQGIDFSKIEKFEDDEEIICKICNSSSQIWINQLSGYVTCHRLGCNNNDTDLEIIEKEI
jgi:hypothetical protein